VQKSRRRKKRREKKIKSSMSEVSKSLASPRERGGHQENSNDVKGGHLWPSKSSAHVA
jgi:hypothetical protein